MKIQDIKAIVTPAQWKVVDEAMNDIRRETAAQLQTLTQEHESATQSLRDDYDKRIEELTKALDLAEERRKLTEAERDEFREHAKPERQKLAEKLDAQIAAMLKEREALARG